MAEQRTDVARFFTKARRIPILIGRTHDGTKIPGGPYTLGQVITGLVLLFALWKTADLWAQFGLAGNVVIFVAVFGGAVFGVGKLPRTGRNPIFWVADFLSLATRAPGGSINGRPVRVARPHQLRHKIVAPLVGEDLVADEESGREEPQAASSAEPTPATSPQPAPAPQAAPAASRNEARPALQLTNVQRLLAGIPAKEDS